MQFTGLVTIKTTANHVYKSVSKAHSLVSHIHCVVPRIPQSTDCTGSRPVHVAIDDQHPHWSRNCCATGQTADRDGCPPRSSTHSVDSSLTYPMANGKGTNPIPSSCDPSHGPPCPPSLAFEFQKGWRATAATTRTAQWHRRASDGRPCVAQPAAGGTAARPAPPPPTATYVARATTPHWPTTRGHRHRDARGIQSPFPPSAPLPRGPWQGTPHDVYAIAYLPYCTGLYCTLIHSVGDHSRAHVVDGGGRWRACVWRAGAPSAAASPSPGQDIGTAVSACAVGEGCGEAELRTRLAPGRGSVSPYTTAIRPLQACFSRPPLPPRLLHVSVRRWPAPGSGRDDGIHTGSSAPAGGGRGPAGGGGEGAEGARSQRGG